MNTTTIFFWVIILLFSVGAPLLKWFREQIEAEKLRRAKAERMEAGATSEAMGQNRMDDLAQRRRAELRALIQSRPVAAPRQPVSEQPGNLSLAERSARERARAVYEQRAAELRRQRAGAQAPQQARIDARQRVDDDEARAEQTRLEDARRRAREATNRKARAAEAARRAQPITPATLPPPTVVTNLQEMPVMGTPAPPSRTPVKTKPGQPARPAVPGAAARLPALRGRNLREILILREIFDPPLALRESDGR